MRFYTSDLSMSHTHACFLPRWYFIASFHISRFALHMFDAFSNYFDVFILLIAVLAWDCYNGRLLHSSNLSRSELMLFWMKLFIIWHAWTLPRRLSRAWQLLIELNCIIIWLYCVVGCHIEFSIRLHHCMSHDIFLCVLVHFSICHKIAVSIDWSRKFRCH